MASERRYDYEYIDEDTVPTDLKCSIYLQPFESPVKLIHYKHTFCRRYVDQSVSEKNVCPLCRSYMIQLPTSEKLYQSVVTTIVLNQLGSLKIRCLLCNESNMERSNWNDHEKKCWKKVIKCRSADIKCNWSGTRDTLAIHLTNCSFQKIRPIIEELKNKLVKSCEMQSDLRKKNSKIQLINKQF